MKLYPGFPAAGHNLAILELKDGNVDLARKSYEDVLKHHPEDLRGLLGIAEIDARQGRVADSLSRLNQAISAHPDGPISPG